MISHHFFMLDPWETLSMGLNVISELFLTYFSWKPMCVKVGIQDETTAELPMTPV